MSQTNPLPDQNNIPKCNYDKIYLDTSGKEKVLGEGKQVESVGGIAREKTQDQVHEEMKRNLKDEKAQWALNKEAADMQTNKRIELLEFVIHKVQLEVDQISKQVGQTQNMNERDRLLHEIKTRAQFQRALDEEIKFLKGKHWLKQGKG